MKMRETRPAPNHVGWLGLASGFIWLLFMPVMTNADGIDSSICQQHKQWEAMLSPDQQQVFASQGFVMTLAREGTGIPDVLISSKVIESCKNRLVAERYFENKLDGPYYTKKDGSEGYRYDIAEDDLNNAKQDLASAVYKALNAKGVWVDGAGHEILNIVSDELQPYWTQWVVRSMEEKKAILLDYFTNNLFESPGSGMATAINQALASARYNDDVALAYFLKKNMGESLDIKQVEKDLRSKPSYPDSDNDNVVEDALRFLSKPGKITLEDAKDFEANIYGWV